MRKAKFGPLGEVSRLTLGGGIGRIWGETSPEEAVATVRAAIDAGIDLIDCAPLYLQAESFVGEAFAGKPPAHVRFTTKVGLGTPPANEAAGRIEASLDASLKAMRLEKIDIFFLHSNIADEAYVYAQGRGRDDEIATRWPLYVEHVIPTFERLRAAGKIGAWGITGIGVPAVIQRALKHTPKPQVVQIITNLLDSAGGIRRYAEPAEPRAILQTACEEGVVVMGIRAVQAGALTNALDREMSETHPERRDYAHAAPFRELCARWGEDPAVIAHRYALSLDGPATIVLGVKNRAELAQGIAAEAAGPLSVAQLQAIDGLGLRA